MKRQCPMLVYAAVNEVRARPGVNMPPLPAGLSKDQMRVRIKQERRSELAYEGFRFFDLKRWKIVKDVLSNITNPGGAKENLRINIIYGLYFRAKLISLEAATRILDIYKAFL